MFAADSSYYDVIFATLSNGKANVSATSSSPDLNVLFFFQLLSVLKTNKVDEKQFLGMKLPSHIFEQVKYF